MLNKEIAARLRSFALSRFGTIKDMAMALEMNPASLHSNYLSGRSLPGAEFLSKLYFHGCDIGWLLTGYGLPSEASDEQIDEWLESCKKRARALKARNQLERDAVDEYVRNMNRFLEQQGKGEGEEENTTS